MAEAATQASETQAAGGGQGQVGARTFTQEELNSILAREKRAWQDSEELKTLRARASRADELEAAQQTATVHLTEERDAALRLAEARAAKYRDALARAEFAARAVSAGIPADRIEAAYRLAERAGITVDEETDTVSGVDGVIAALPAWLKTPTRRPAPDTNSSGGGGLTREQALAQEIERQRATGRYA